MAATAYELWGRKFKIGAKGGSGNQGWFVMGAASELEAKQTVVAAAAEWYVGLPLESMDADEQAPDNWVVTVNYSPEQLEANPEKGAGDSNKAGENPGKKGGGEGGGNVAGDLDPEKPITRALSWTTGGGTQHILRSKSRPDFLRAGGRKAIDCSAIGWTPTGIQGTDVVAPDPEVTITVRIDSITIGWFARMIAMTGTVNDAVWNGFASGEALFIGADGAWQDGDAKTNSVGGWNVTFRFRLQPNEFNVKITDDMIFAQKDGWDLIDVIYVAADAEADPDNPEDIVVIQVPEYAYLHRIYDRTDFGVLGLGDMATLIPPGL